MPNAIPIMKLITHPEKNILTSSFLLVECAESMPIFYERWFAWRVVKKTPADSTTQKVNGGKEKGFIGGY
jgi:hypothetical protein